MGCGASRSNSFQNTERDGCPAHMMKPACGGGNVLAHARSGAKEVPELVVAAAISSRGWDALKAEHRSTSALDTTMVLLKTIVEIAVCAMPHAATERGSNGPGIGVMAIRRDPVGDHTGDGLC